MNRFSDSDASDASIPPGSVRLQRFLADAGVASRRHAEIAILDGRVEVNGARVMQLPAFVDPQRDDVRVDGRRVRPQKPKYFLLHKPKGYVCTDEDPDGRPLAIDLVPPMESRLFIVGRLDKDSTGLLLLTNDGELAQQVLRPGVGLAKVYRVVVRGRVSEDFAAKLRQGVYLSTGRARAGAVTIIHRDRDRSSLEITIDQERSPQIRRLLATLGHPVKELKRIYIGPLTLKGLPQGTVRPLTGAELRELRAAVERGLQTAAAGPGPRRPRTRNAARRRKPAAPPVHRTETPSDRPRRRLIT